MMKNKAFFLDRDGTINEDYDFVHTPERWTWCEGAVESLKWMKEQGFKIIVVTNQSGVSRGLFSLQEVQKLHAWVDEELEKAGVTIDRWCVAPWHPKFSHHKEHHLLDYRKPGTGFFEEAIEDFNLDPTQCFMIGDKQTDLIPALKLGMIPFYIKSRFHSQQDHSWFQEQRISPFPSIGTIINHLKKKV